MSRGYQLKPDEIYDTIDLLCKEYYYYNPEWEKEYDNDQELWWRYIDQDEEFQQHY